MRFRRCDLGVYAAMLVCVGLASCKKAEQKKVSATTVNVETTSLAGDKSSQQYVGVVEASTTASVSFATGGTLTKILVEEGQFVTKGQLLAETDATQARNMLTVAQSMASQANDALSRMAQVHNNNSLADMKWVEIQSKAQQAQAQLQIAKKNLADCRVYAPFNGVVGKKMLNVGENALPDMPVVTVLKIDGVKVKVSIPEKEIANINANTKSEIIVEALNGKVFNGGKIEKGVQANPLTHTYDIRVNIANAQHAMLPGMVANVKFNISGKVTGEGITLPITAIQQDFDGKKFVWLVTGNKAQRRTVEVGETSGDRITVTNGLTVGEKVVTSGCQKLSEGSEVIMK